MSERSRGESNRGESTRELDRNARPRPSCENMQTHAQTSADSLRKQQRAMAEFGLFAFQSRHERLDQLLADLLGNLFLLAPGQHQIIKAPRVAR